MRETRERITAEEYQAKYLELKHGYPAATFEEWREFCFELLLQIMEDNKEILKRLKEGD